MRLPGMSGLALTAMVALATGPAAAGRITAKAPITYCAVQAVDCLEADPEGCRLIFNSALAVGEAIISDTGSLCYRRNERPDDCSSNLQQSWSCITNFVDTPKRDAIR